MLKRKSAVASLGPPHCCWLLLCDCFSVAGWSFSMGSAYQFHSWRVFVVVCALPCVSAVVALTFMPESPRFYLEVREKRCIVAAAAPFSLLMILEMTLKGFQRTEEQPFLSGVYFFTLKMCCCIVEGTRYVRCGGVKKKRLPRLHPHFPFSLPSFGYFR